MVIRFIFYLIDKKGFTKERFILIMKKEEIIWQLNVPKGLTISNAKQSTDNEKLKC